jgi:hypothetical protein
VLSTDEPAPVASSHPADDHRPAGLQQRPLLHAISQRINAAPCRKALWSKNPR